MTKKKKSWKNGCVGSMMIIDRIFITVLLLSISGFVFCIVFFSLERYAFRLTSAKTMVSVNTTALFSFVIPEMPVLLIDA